MMKIASIHLCTPEAGFFVGETAQRTLPKAKEHGYYLHAGGVERCV